MPAFKLEKFANNAEKSMQPDDYGLTITGNLEDRLTHLVIEYVFNGAITNIKWPGFDALAHRQARLWEHTCGEMFVAARNKKDYCEYNLSPSSQWNAFVFSDYRQFQQDLEINNISISCSHSSQEILTLTAMVPLPSNLHHVSLDVGITTVIETTDDGFFYFALTHCSTKPDFHIRASFILHLER